MRRTPLMLTAVALVMAASIALGGTPAGAVNRPWPSSGWTNPVTDPSFEDWGFASCDPPYNGNRAHLGADAQGPAPAGSPVRALAPGRVTGVIASGWPGAAIGVLHESSDGGFVALYVHVVPTVSEGQLVAQGQSIATLYDWPNSSNEHLHLGVRPLAGGEDPDDVAFWGSDECVDGSVDRHGYVDPLPWLAARQPAPLGPQPPSADAGADRTIAQSGPTAATTQLDGAGHDPEDGPLSFEWTQTGGPDAVIEDRRSAVTRVTLPAIAEHSTEAVTFRLTVIDASGLSTSDDVTLTVTRGAK